MTPTLLGGSVILTLSGMPVPGMPVSDRQGLPASRRLPSTGGCQTAVIPLDPSTSGLLSRFSRIKGSGTFSLDEFCALTGLPQARSVKVLKLGEKHGIILCLASGFYLLKPLPKSRKSAWADWRPPRAKLQAFLDLIPARGKIENRALVAASGLSRTVACRYLRILKFTGNVRRIHQGHFYWQKLCSNLSEIPSWQQVVEATSCHLPVPAVAKPPSPSTPRLPEE